MVLKLLLLLFILIVFIKFINYIAYFVSCVFGSMERVTEFPEELLHLDAAPIVTPKCT